MTTRLYIKRAPVAITDTLATFPSIVNAEMNLTVQCTNISSLMMIDNLWIMDIALCRLSCYRCFSSCRFLLQPCGRSLVFGHQLNRVGIL